jgi:hypothetical protein
VIIATAALLGGVIFLKDGYFHIADSSFSNTYHGGIIVADTSLLEVSNIAHLITIQPIMVESFTRQQVHSMLLNQLM